jgi:hypothetical protein
MHSIAALGQHVFARANSDPLALLLPAFVILVAIAFAARILKSWHAGQVVALARPRFRGRWFLTSLGVAAFAMTTYLGDLANGSSVNLEADMRVSSGQFIEVRANDPNLPPLRVPIVPNERRIYRFEDIPANLTYLRIDPTESPAADISIYSVSIVSAGRALRWFGPGDLRSWRMLNLRTSDDHGAFSCVSTTYDPILETKISFLASLYPAWVEYTFDIFRRPHVYTLSFFARFLIFLAAGIGTARGAADAALVAAIAVLAYPLAILVRKLPMSPPPVASAIGYANYHGYPKSQDYCISFLLFALCAVIAWLAARFWSVDAIERKTEENSGEGSNSMWRGRSPGAAIFLVLVTLYLPNLRGELAGLRAISFHPVGWDRQNSLFWAYLVSHGFLPFRDFWYPYSGFFAHLLPFPTGVIIRAAENILILWFLYLALRRVLPWFRSAAFSLFLFMFVPVFENEFSGWFRYLLGVNVALLYVALQATPKPDRRLQACFACLVAFAFWYEPAQLVYAGAGILAHVGLAVWPKLGAWADWRAAAARVGPALRQRIVTVALPTLVGVFPVFLLLAAAGMLPGFIAFHLTIPDQSVYGALPADLSQWTFPVLRFDTIFLSLFFTLVLAFYGWFRDRRGPSAATVALLVVCLAGVMTMQKQLMRPPVLVQLQLYPYLAILLYGVSAWHRKTSGQAAVAAVFVGYIAGIAQYHGTVKQAYSATLSAPHVLAGDLSLFMSRDEGIHQVSANEFDPRRFTEFRPENDVVRVLKSEFGWTNGQNLYVLGDESVFYILVGQQPPYVTSNYNCSPLVEQEHVLKWLQTQRPRFVIWNPTKDSFDAVPHIVRLPIIYQYVVEHYSILKTVGPYEILINTMERPSADPLYWPKELGNSIDLGRIPQLTRASEYQECKASQCGTVLYIRLSSAAPSGKATATVNSSVGPMQVNFDLAAGYKDYIIDLDRLWFRGFLTGGNTVSLSIPGAEVRQEKRLRKIGILY